jgi:predicted outer membrane repeat protein
MALEARHCNVTLIDSHFEGINATSAIFVQNSNATITDTSFRGMRGPNAALSSQGNTILLRKVLFENNFATQSRGGAIRSESESMQIVESQFFDNKAVLDGGAISASALDVSRSLFRRNAAADVGGAIYGDNVRITECDFEANVATSGSALSMPASQSVLLIAKSSFFANLGSSTVHLRGANFTIELSDSCLCNNTASIDCQDVTGSLVANASTFADDALRCPTTMFQPTACLPTGCQRRAPFMQTTTRIASTTLPTTASEATSAAVSSLANSSAITTASSSSTIELANSSEPDNGLDAGTLGAIIGGSVAGLLIVLGVVVFIVVRKRKRKTSAVEQSASSAPAPAPAIVSSSVHYGAVPLNAMGAADYDLGGIPVIPPNVPGSGQYGVAGLQELSEYESGRLQ